MTKNICFLDLNFLMKRLFFEINFKQILLFIFSFFFSHGRNAGYPAPPAQSRTCGFPASGSLVALAFARIFTVTRYKIQLLFLAVRLAYVIQSYMSGISFLCELRASIRSFPMWLAFPTSE